MSETLNHYPEYQPTKIGWLSKLPSHWKLQRLKYVGESIIGLTYSPDDVVDPDEGVLVLRSSNVQNGELAFHDNVYVKGVIPTRLRVQQGDILICSRNGSRSLIGKNAQIDERTAGSTFGAFMTVFRSEMSGYLSHVFNSPVFEYQSGTFLTATINQLTVGNLNSFEVPIPPLEEQKQIAAFLDYETAKIDALIEKQQQLIALLGEKRQAVISHAVTKGLNPDVAMRDSGIEWLGDVPEHWETSRIGWLCTYISYGFTNPMPTTDDGPFMLTAADISFEGVRYVSARRTSQSAFNDLSGKSKPAIGDVLVTKDGSLGRVTTYSGEHLVCISQSIALLRPDKERVDPNFLALALSGADYQAKMIFDAGGTTIKHIYISILAKMNFWLPGLAEQREILIEASQRTDKMDKLIAAASETAELLRERRTALISAAVTGKIDVRNWKPPSSGPNTKKEVT